MSISLLPYHPLSLSLKPRTSIKNCQSESPIPRSRAELSNRRSFFLLSLPFSLSSFLLLGSSISGCGSFSAFALTETEYAYDPVSPSERDASAIISHRVSEAVDLLEKGRGFQVQGDFISALSFFSQVVESYKDLAFSDYARVGRALALYEVGDREEAIAEMEDVSISLKGYPQVHAALAAALYADKHAPLLAENQFAIATVLDPHFTDLSYVRDIKHWPPSLVTSLEHFITLS